MPLDRWTRCGCGSTACGARRRLTVDDAVAVLGELGIRPEVARWDRASVPRGDAAWVVRRLCLPPEPSSPRHRQAATLTWRF